MKKLLLAVVSLCCSLSSYSQVAAGDFSVDESTVYYGVRLGGNISYISGDEPNLSNKWGLTLGGVIGIRISETPPLFLESGIYYTQMGSKKNRNEINLNYFEIPFLIKAGFELQNDFAILPFIGPVFGLGVAGKTKGYDENGKFYSKSSYSDDQISTTETSTTTNSVPKKYLRPDAGMKLGCGVEWNMIYLEIGYRFGLANILDSDEFAQHNNAFFANIGVNF